MKDRLTRPPGGCRQCRDPSGTRTCRRNRRSGHCRRLQGHYRRCRRGNRNCRPKPRFLKGLFTILFKGVLQNCRKNCPRPKPPRRRRPSKPRKCIICRDRSGGRSCGPTNLLLGCRGMNPSRTRWCRRKMNACFIFQKQYRECIGRNRNCNG